MTKPLSEEELRGRLIREFASAFIRIRGAHNPNPGEPCAWCQLAAEQAAEALLTSEPLLRLLATLEAREREGLDELRLATALQTGAIRQWLGTPAGVSRSTALALAKDIAAEYAALARPETQEDDRG